MREFFRIVRGNESTQNPRRARNLMNMHSYYQLFDLESGNLIADYAREHEAWDALRRLDPEDLRGLGLMHMENDELTLVAMDEELVRRVLGNVIPFATREPAKRSRGIR